MEDGVYGVYVWIGGNIINAMEITDNGGWCLWCL